MKRKYRIKELNNLFYIEVLKFEKSGFLFFEKTNTRWVRASLNGDPFFLTPNLPPFKSLKKAQEQIKKWAEKPKYHEV
jgi:hypothetical protein